MALSTPIMIRVDRRSPIWTLLFAFIPLALGGLILGVGDILQGIQSQKWLDVRAEVLSSRLTPSFLAPDQPSIRYRFILDEQIHISNQIWAGRVIGIMPVVVPSASKQLVGQYVQGQLVTVRVDPDKPERSVLIVGPQRALWWTGTFLFCVLLIFFAPLLFFRKTS